MSGAKARVGRVELKHKRRHVKPPEASWKFIYSVTSRQPGSCEFCFVLLFLSLIDVSERPVCSIGEA